MPRRTGVPENGWGERIDPAHNVPHDIVRADAPASAIPLEEFEVSLTTPAFEELLEALARPDAYPHDVGEIQVLQTHISAVFLVGEFAYKIKKPLNLGFLDFTTLERRRAACEDEVRLNRRLAPKVYLGVVPVTREGSSLRLNGPGEAVEYAVQMERLPADRTFEKLLEAGRLDRESVVRLARKIARFHASGSSSPEIEKEARWSVVAANARQNFEQMEASVGQTVSAGVFEKLRRGTEEMLRELRPLIEERARTGAARDTHGDLHLDHIYSLPGKAGVDELVIIDCIEFNTRFRYADPVSDIAFLVMDLDFHGREDLGRVAAEAYFEEGGDEEGRRLLPYYASYRAIVRAKVEGMALREAEVPTAQKDRLLCQARAHALLALRYLAPPRARPVLILVGGLPGSGKSRLCRNLEAGEDAFRLDSDEVRKELAGLDPGQSAASEWSEGIYTREWNDRTYAALLDRASDALFHGKRVLVEATFREEKRRRAFLERGRSLGVPVLFIECVADESEIRERLSRRSRDVSDADIEIFESAKRKWEPVGTEIEAIHRRVSTAGSTEETKQAALELLTREGLA